MKLDSWLTATLRAAGITVVETNGWSGRSHGSFPDNVKVVWHHDASPPGDSPGVLDWMISNWSSSSANIWINRAGVWHLVGAGVSYHAGKTLPGMPTNQNSIGIETDHTTGENWPAALLDSLRRGTAAIFGKQNVAADWLHFHKTICDPPGRKVDPDGLDLGPERSKVAGMIGGTPPPVKPTTPPPPKEWTDTVNETEFIAAMVKALDSPSGQAALVKAVDARLVAQLGKGAVTNPNSVLNQGVSARIGADRRADLAAGITVTKK